MRQIKLKPVSNTTTKRINALPLHDNYIALDWSNIKMDIARIAIKRPDKVKVMNTYSDIKELKNYLKNQHGSKIFTIEESTPAHCLNVELLYYVDKIVICDPYKNKLLCSGPKNDLIDAKKLCSLLKSGLLTEVYYSTEESCQLRKYVSAYEDLVKMGIRLQNQRSAFLAQIGKAKKTKERNFDAASNFILNNVDESSLKRYIH